MASDPKPAEAAPTVLPSPLAPAMPPGPTVFQLAEACARISETDRRVELLAAFHAAELAAGHLSGTEDEYRTRLAAFAAQPA